jgi:hypothetical protein
LVLAAEVPEEQLGSVGEQMAAGQRMLDLEPPDKVGEGRPELLHAHAARTEGGNRVRLDEVGEGSQRPAFGGMISGSAERIWLPTG